MLGMIAQASRKFIRAALVIASRKRREEGEAEHAGHRERQRDDRDPQRRAGRCRGAGGRRPRGIPANSVPVTPPIPTAGPIATPTCASGTPCERCRKAGPHAARIEVSISGDAVAEHETGEPRRVPQPQQALRQVGEGTAAPPPACCIGPPRRARSRWPTSPGPARRRRRPPRRTSPAN